jgi:hypothetical protein
VNNCIGIELEFRLLQSRREDVDEECKVICLEERVEAGLKIEMRYTTALNCLPSLEDELHSCIKLSGIFIRFC